MRRPRRDQFKSHITEKGESMKVDRFVHRHKKIILVVTITLFAGFFGGYAYGRYAERTAHASDDAHSHDTSHHQ